MRKKLTKKLKRAVKAVLESESIRGTARNIIKSIITSKRYAKKRQITDSPKFVQDL